MSGALVLTSDPTPAGVVTITLNNPKKLNSLSAAMLEGIGAALSAAGSDDRCKAVLLTGSGRYYCAGADFSGMMVPMLPSSLVAHTRAMNEKLFLHWLDFPKPLFACCNGPAVGAAVTTSGLCDRVFCTPETTFLTPFSALGITPEGCSSYTFEHRYGSEFAARMLERSETVSAEDAKAAGFVHMIVPGGPGALLHQANLEAESWIADGRQRDMITSGELVKLKEVNRVESEQLGKSIISAEFFKAQMKGAERRQNSKMAWAFWLAARTQPVWSKL